jgi:hypothetical protein
LAAFSILEAAEIADTFKSPDYWAGFYDEVYERGQGTSRARIDDCVVGTAGGHSWVDLSETQKRDPELQFCLLNSKGYPSGTIAPDFARRWLQ